MFAPLFVEIAKLKRSLALALAGLAPGLIALFAFFNSLRLAEPMPWEMWMNQTAAIWAFFMLPMSVTALTALVAHMEHGPRSWDHLRALPVARWKIYAAKATCVLALVAAMTVAVLGLTVGAVELAAAIKPQLRPTGAFELAGYGRTLAMMFIAALLLVAVQLWTALRFASFVPGLALGIGGTFFAVVATSAREGIALPWQMPVNMLATEAWRVNTALGLGGGLGAVALVLLVLHLSRREVL